MKKFHFIFSNKESYHHSNWNSKIWFLRKKEEEIPDKFLLFFEKKWENFPGKRNISSNWWLLWSSTIPSFHSSIGHLLFISFQFFSLKTNRIFTEKKKIRKINVIKKKRRKVVVPTELNNRKNKFFNEENENIYDENWNDKNCPKGNFVFCLFGC